MRDSKIAHQIPSLAAHLAQKLSPQSRAGASGARACPGGLGLGSEALLRLQFQLCVLKRETKTSSLPLVPFPATNTLTPGFGNAGFLMLPFRAVLLNSFLGNQNRMV